MSVSSIGSTTGAPEAAPPVEVSRRAAPADLRVVADPRSGSRSRRVPLVAAVVGIVTGLAIAIADRASFAPTACAVVWATVAWCQALDDRRAGPVRVRVRTDVTTALAFVSGTSLAGTLGLLSLSDVRWCLVVVLGAAGSSLLLRLVVPRPPTVRRVVLVGGHQDLEDWASSPAGSDVLLTGCCVVDAGAALAVQPAVGVPTTTSLETLRALVSTVGADEVLVVPGRAVDSSVVREVTWALEKDEVGVGVVCPVSSVPARRLRGSTMGDTTVLDVGLRGASKAEQATKLVIDRVGGAMLLLVTLPVLALLMLAVRIDSPGPALFMQTRVGRDGEPFRMFKLRSMYADADSMKEALLGDNEADGALFKIRLDPRVTRVGFWLRRSSLDELPQLLNVLWGDMSLVGPRPALPGEVETYHDTARRRLLVKPGITGLWQVSGRSDLGWDEALRLDLYYADNWRLVDDFVIAARTFRAVTMARGAY